MLVVVVVVVVVLRVVVVVVVVVVLHVIGAASDHMEFANTFRALTLILILSLTLTRVGGQAGDRDGYSVSKNTATYTIPNPWRMNANRWCCCGVVL